MSKLNKYLKSIMRGKTYQKACKKLVKSIAKECEEYDLMSGADLDGVAGGTLPHIPKGYVLFDPKRLALNYTILGGFGPTTSRVKYKDGKWYDVKWIGGKAYINSEPQPQPEP